MFVCLFAQIYIYIYIYICVCVITIDIAHAHTHTRAHGIMAAVDDFSEAQSSMWTSSPVEK